RLIFVPFWVGLYTLGRCHFDGFNLWFLGLGTWSSQRVFTCASQKGPVPLLGILLILIPALLIILTSHAPLSSIGRPRPNMLSHCHPGLNAANAGCPSYGLSNSSICTTPINSCDFQDGFPSFPSGHSSVAFAGLDFLSLYLAGKLHLLYRCKAILPLLLQVTRLTSERMYFFQQFFPLVVW
ncbi:hypothetical protein MJO29_010758, partial [Puccinia striiformis f. sp. tritici]